MTGVQTCALPIFTGGGGIGYIGNATTLLGNAQSLGGGGIGPVGGNPIRLAGRYAR